MILKNWLSSKSYREATLKHAKNASPYLLKTTVALSCLIATSLGYNSWQLAKNSQATYNRIDQLCNLPLDFMLIGLGYGITKNAVIKPAIALTALNTGIQCCIDEDLTVGFSKSAEQIKGVIYGTKEIACCVGNALGYVGVTIGIDGIYDYCVMPCVGDILQIH